MLELHQSGDFHLRIDPVGWIVVVNAVGKFMWIWIWLKLRKSSK